MKKVFENDWQEILAEELEKPYYQQLRKTVAQEYNLHTVYPAKEDIMNVFNTVSYKDVKVVILGQDPYHGPGQAHGMCFSVRKGVPHPPSLRNIFVELQNDLGCPTPKDGYLMKWAQQGVFLLNTVLTVRKGEANSHKGIGWEQFTDAVIEKLARRHDPIIFVLWGKPAQTKQTIIKQNGSHHIILQAPHPSPLSAHRGFFGSKPFSKINDQLKQWGKEPIDWCLDEQ
ncbi:uracil-DNA glycosylase [Ureibacillus acetophenoni]|uniref:Uracil-DNA glycosylase n=1 Tax=Ureibacillus acetophenoni TaxID=614649 RepID=A0A285TYK1_9BACL|nr:uracil-DNA glycosylase [Ureibacillus acetophenoni]SOC34669.1 uracil-DNA glycosylase [Ureibacillus acetophenoni]